MIIRLKIKFDSMKVFITGIKGFIGSHLALHMSKLGHDVLGIDNLMHPCALRLPRSFFRYGDVRYYQDLAPFIFNADAIFHLAAQIHVDKSITNPQETIDINVGGTLNVLEACRKAHKKLIFASSSEVYGTAQELTMNEAHPLDPQSPYAASKAMADRLCHSYFKTYDLDITVCRNFNVFGKFQSFDSYGGVIARFCHRVLQGNPPQIFGTGEQVRDYMNVDDAVNAYQLCMSPALKGESINFGTGETISVNEIADLIIQTIGDKNIKPVNIRPRQGEVMRLCADITKAKKLGFEPKTDVRKDIAAYAKWYANEYGQRPSTTN